LINIVRSRKKRAQIEQFRKYYGSSPVIDCRGIVSGSKEQFWRPIPSSGDLMAHTSFVCWYAHPSETEVCELDIAAGSNQNITRLNVSMNDALGMTVSDGIEEHKGIGLDI
jgi:hypothetical protein